MNKMKPTKRKTESPNNSKSKKTEIDYSRKSKQQLISILEGVCLELENIQEEIKAKYRKIDILEQKFSQGKVNQSPLNQLVYKQKKWKQCFV